MSQSQPFFVRDFSAGPIAVSAADGERLYRCIESLVRAGQPVELSFAGVTTVSGAFLNTAVGQICRDYSEDRVRELLSVCDAEPDVRGVFGRAMRNAGRYYQNPEAFDEAWVEVIGDECRHEETTML